MTAPMLDKILVIEDEPDIQAVVKLALESVGGFTVEICNSGNEAVEKAPGVAPDLILLDVMMPGMDGPTTLKALRGMPGFEATPVVFMTAKIMPSDIENYVKIGAIDVISKPFDPMTLAGKIKDIWENHLG